MTNELSKPDFDPLELRWMISAWCDGAIEPIDFERLQALLAREPEARRIYLQFMEIHSGVQGEVTAREYLDSFVPPTPMPGALSPTNLNPPQILQFQSWPWRGWVRRWGFWAALLLICIAGGIIWHAFEQTNSQTNASAGSMVLARVVEQSADCQWNLDRGGDAPGALEQCDSTAGKPFASAAA